MEALAVIDMLDQIWLTGFIVGLPVGAVASLVLWLAIEGRRQ